MCLPIIWDLVAVCGVRSPSQHTLVPVVPLEETVLLISVQRKTQGLPTPLLSLTAELSVWACLRILKSTQQLSSADWHFSENKRKKHTQKWNKKKKKTFCKKCHCLPGFLLQWGHSHQQQHYSNKELDSQTKAFVITRGSSLQILSNIYISTVFFLKLQLNVLIHHRLLFTVNNKLFSLYSYNINNSQQLWN